jgi:hypothetical protein
LQRNDSLQRIEMGCETFREKRFENYFATALQRYLQLETIYSFQESFEGKRLCNDNFRFSEKLIPVCQETIIVSIRLQRINLEKLPKWSIGTYHFLWSA